MFTSLHFNLNTNYIHILYIFSLYLLEILIGPTASMNTNCIHILYIFSLYLLEILIGPTMCMNTNCIHILYILKFSMSFIFRLQLMDRHVLKIGSNFLSAWVGPKVDPTLMHIFHMYSSMILLH